jgi:S-adenosylmethionine:tRNA ribosyltransferase-isomerase
MLRAFLDDATLADANVQLEAQGYRTHEFGDSVLIERKTTPSWTQRTPTTRRARGRCCDCGIE